MTNDLIYVYCLSNGPPDVGLRADMTGLHFLNFHDFWVIVKYVSEGDFSEENFKKNISDIPWLDANVREHIRVINAIMENNTVIPFKFGTIFQAEESLKKFVSDYSGSLTGNFQYIEGKEEWAVKIYCDRRALSERIDELSEEANQLEKQIMASSPGKAFLLKRKKTDLIDNEMDRLCKVYGQEFFNQLESLSESTSFNNLLPKDFTGREDTMILNAVFLIRKNKVGDFKIAIEKLRKEDRRSCFFIEATGPWPPFSFISLKEKA
jgi:hypothetical protein